MQHTRLDTRGRNPLVQLGINALETLTAGEHLQFLMGLQEDDCEAIQLIGASSLILCGALQRALGGGILGTELRQDPLLVNEESSPLAPHLRLVSS